MKGKGGRLLLTSKRALRVLAVVAVLGVVGAACAKKTNTGIRYIILREGDADKTAECNGSVLRHGDSSSVTRIRPHPDVQERSLFRNATQLYRIVI